MSKNEDWFGPDAATFGDRVAGAREAAGMTQAQLARRLGVPLRGGGSLTSSKLPDAQAAQESADTLMPAVLGGVNLMMQSAGWLEGGLTVGYEKFVMDCDHLGMMHRFTAGLDLAEEEFGLDAFKEVGPGNHFLGCTHTQERFKTAFYDSSLNCNIWSMRST